MFCYTSSVASPNAQPSIALKIIFDQQFDFGPLSGLILMMTQGWMNIIFIAVEGRALGEAMKDVKYV